MIWSICARGDCVEVDARCPTLCMAVRQFQGRDGRHDGDGRICRFRRIGGDGDGRSRRKVETKKEKEWQALRVGKKKEEIRGTENTPLKYSGGEPADCSCKLNSDRTC